jgi:stringent starvation protein B
VSDAVSSTKPYLIRAIHEWCADHGFTPYLAVTVDERTTVPREFVRAGEIVLNVSMSATDRLSIGNDFITFQARFGGVARTLSIPVEQVSAIYARENGQGMAFEVPKPLAIAPTDAQVSPQEHETDPTERAVRPDRPDRPDRREDRSARREGPAGLTSIPALAPVADPSKPPDSTEPPPSPGPSGGRPRLTRVK